VKHRDSFISSAYWPRNRAGITQLVWSLGYELDNRGSISDRDRAIFSSAQCPNYPTGTGGFFHGGV
jgi:hypothetical protein